MAILLTGLDLDGFPLSALAAYGLLRVLRAKGVEARLSFEDAPARPVAKLHAQLDRKALLDLLVDFSRNAPRERWGLFPGGPRRLEELREAEAWEQVGEEFRVAYLPQGQEGKTPFDTTSGQQKFLALLEKALKALEGEGNAREAFSKALFEEGVLLPKERPGSLLMRYRKGAIRLGWHPSQRRRTADQARIAEKEVGERTVRPTPAAVLLAWEALPLFPFPPGAGLPLGFSGNGGEGYLLHLPTPHVPVGLEDLAYLVALAPTLGDRAPDLPVWVSVRVGGGHLSDGYPCFLEARPLPRKRVEEKALTPSNFAPTPNPRT